MSITHLYNNKAIINTDVLAASQLFEMEEEESGLFEVDNFTVFEDDNFTFIEDDNFLFFEDDNFTFSEDDEFISATPMSDEELLALLEADLAERNGVFFSISNFELPEDDITRFMTISINSTQLMKATVYRGDNCDMLSCYLAEAGATEIQMSWTPEPDESYIVLVQSVEAAIFTISLSLEEGLAIGLNFRE